MRKNLTESMTKHSISLIAILSIMACTVGAHQFFSAVYVADAETITDLPPPENIVIADPFADITLESRAVYVHDLATNETVFSRNENVRLPLASIVKLMTALVARSTMNGSAMVTLTQDDLSLEGDTGLHPGERWRMEDLLEMMLLVSSNDAAHAIAGFVGSNGQSSNDVSMARENFIQKMNTFAQELGFTTMEFFNETGLDFEGKTRNGGYGSAREVAVLISALWKNYPEVIESTAQKDAHIFSQDAIDHGLINTNEITGRIPGLIASKTGYTDLTGGNLAIIFDIGINHPVVAVVLGSSYKGRFDDMAKIVSAVLAREQ